jgi:hypothetical protein
VANFTPRPLYPVKEHRYPRVHVEHESWAEGGSRAGLDVLKIEPQFIALKSHDLVTVPTTLSRTCSCGRITIPTSNIWSDSLCTKRTPLPRNFIHLHQFRRTNKFCSLLITPRTKSNTALNALNVGSNYQTTRDLCSYHFIQPTLFQHFQQIHIRE